MKSGCYRVRADTELISDDTHRVIPRVRVHFGLIFAGFLTGEDNDTVLLALYSWLRPHYYGRNAFGVSLFESASLSGRDFE